MAKGLTASKAKKILEDGTVRGKALTEKQKKFFGAVAAGVTPLKAINGAGVPKAQFGLANKLYKLLKGADNVADVANTVRKTSNVVDNAWAVKPLPGLHLKSTMNNGAISKIIEPKTGLINTEQALAIINKESGGTEKVNLIRQQLGDNIPKKMDYNEFRAATQKSLIPLEVKINPSGNSDYGLENIGYNPLKVEHEALTISNRDQFGTGSSMHDNPDDTLGHVHFLKDADNPNTLTITQIQSDAFQGQYNTKQTKEQLERSLSANKKHAEAQRKLHELAVQDPDSKTWIYPDGTVLTNNAYKEALDGQKNWNKMQQADIDNYSQKQLLAKNHEERYLQEIVNYAGLNGNNKIRIPTMETAAKVQDFNDMQNNMGVLKKYKNQPKTIKKLYGQDVITVTDSKGNTWYEFDIPESFKSGTGEIKAFKEGGWLDKFAMGGSLPGASGMMYARTSGISPEEPKKAQDGTVMYGTPEYKKAYEEGTFADVPNQLDEVVMYSGIDYEKYPYYNDLTAEQRKYFNDPGPIGRGVRRAAYTKRGLAEDTYDVVNPLMYGMLGLAGGMAAGPALSTLGRGAAPYVSRYALKPIQRALSYKPFGGPVSIGNVVDAGSAAYAAYATPEAYDKFKENPNFDTGTDLALTAMDLVPFSEIFTGGKNIKKLYNKGKNIFKKTPEVVDDVVKLESKGIDLETTPFREAFTQPNIFPTSSPLPKNMEPYLSRRIYPFTKEQEIFESFLPAKGQIRNVDSKSIYYDPNGKIITKAEADNLLYPPEYQKNGGKVDKAQWGKLLKLAKKYGKKLFNFAEPAAKVDNAPTLKYTDDLSYEAKKDIRELNYKVQSKTDKETRKLGKPHEAQEEYGEGWKYSDEVDFNNPEEVAAHRKRWIDSQKKGNFLYQNRSFPLFDETSDVYTNLTRYNLSDYLKKGLDKRFGTIGNDYTTGYGHKGLDYETNYLNDYFKDYRVGLPDGSTVPYGKLDGSVEIDPSSFNSSDEVVEELRRLAQTRMGDQFNNAFEKTSRIDFGDLLKNKNRNGGWLSKYENGGVIEDNRGQWAHPGEITKINSNNITMKGVNYPVLGISDTGDTKMMQPGKDYKFKGNSVTEFPMAKDGKSLVELNQLTNFTNYNTPQPGGWLDKYH